MSAALLCFYFEVFDYMVCQLEIALGLQFEAEEGSYLFALTIINTEEFVAHSSAVNCLKIGRKSSRVLVTGGEDFKVNLWAIGKPNAILVCFHFYYLLLFLDPSYSRGH